MATEIELKYLVVNNGVENKITTLLNEQGVSYSYDKNSLSNRYFDTQKLAFRQHDFGLRVRAKNEQREQTIKTAGQVIGGLHKRPEYNIDIQDNFPNLALFPKEIWPAGIHLPSWQNDLVVLFSTDFERHTWTIQFQTSEIELAFDLGNICSSGRTTDICEIELELLTGNESDLFDLAALLMSTLLMRPGTQSKAARGYFLWHNEPVSEIAEFPFIPLTGKDSLALAFIDGTTFSLTHLHKVIEQYFSNPSLHNLSLINHALLLIRHGFWLFDTVIPDEMANIRKEISHFLKMLAWQNNAKNLHELITKSSSYRKKIEYNQQLVSQLKLEKRRFPSSEQVFEMLQSTRFNQLQLSLLKLILAGKESLLVNHTEQPSFFRFCSSKLESSLRDIEEEMPLDSNLSAEQYLAQKRTLNRSLLTGSWCGQIFDDKARADYRAPWFDIMHGITELETLTMLREQLLQLQAVERVSDQTQKPEKLLIWLDCKIENLLHALDASRQMALQVPPYWRA
ncbi:MAG: inorganic triphosphatase [Thalassotalea sp.]